MFGVIKSMFGGSNDDLPKLTFDLEKSMEANLSDPRLGDQVVSLATKIRTLMFNSKTETNDKIRILSLLNRAKVRALSHGTTDSYRVFAALDSISGDLFRL
jgi:hypothetical protein